MGNTNYIENGEIVAFVDSTLFSKTTVMKCLYWYGDKFYTAVSCDNNGNYIIKLKSQPGASIIDGDLPYYLQKLERDLIDFHLRNIVNEESHSIRELLVAKAFSNGEYDEVPPGEVSDPVGFNPHL
jgi:His-Xaa-Ser system protein HxsD